MIKLDDYFWNMVTFVEQTFLMTGTMPTEEYCKDNMPGYLPESINNAMRMKSFRDACEARGLEVPTIEGGVVSYKARGALNERQLAVANLMLDFRDGRSQKKKLAEMGVSTQEYQNWLAQPGYQQYIRGRAELLLDENIHEGHVALLTQVRGGNLGAIKLFYEVTGRHNSLEQTRQIDPKRLIMSVMEIILKRVPEADVRAAIAEDLLILADGVDQGMAPAQAGTSLAPVKVPIRSAEVVEGELVIEKKNPNQLEGLPI